MVAIRNALESIKSYKVRVFIAITWIVMGVTALIVVMSVGEAIEKEISKLAKKNSSGVGKVEFLLSGADYENVGLIEQPFDEKTIEKISMIDGVRLVTPSVDKQTGVGEHYYPLVKIGLNEYTPTIRPFDESLEIELIEGVNFNVGHANRRVLLLDQQTAGEMFGGDEEALGKFVEMDGISFEVIGVIGATLENSQQLFNSYVPKNIFKDIINQPQGTQVGVTSIDVVMSPGYDKSLVLQNVVAKLTEIRPDVNGLYQVPFEDVQKELSMKIFQQQVSMIMSGVVILALFFGGVGIMNVMYMSVMERRREIGIRRALGATPKDIIVQFITESVVITIIGGIVGVTIGCVAVLIVDTKLPFVMSINGFSCIFGVSFSIIVGIMFGMLPASSASKLEPIRAIQGLR